VVADVRCVICSTIELDAFFGMAGGWTVSTAGTVALPSLG
jgi:hypothetical protein